MSNLANPFDEMEVVSTLLNEGIDQGYLTYDQILETVPDIEANLPLLEMLLEEAQTAGVPIYESEDEIGVPMNGKNGIVKNGKGGPADAEETSHAAP
ncbi:MAG TPA: hypothetical protein EYH05_12490, partial [Anaerolineae bacterium]|nr:hypothetical protein [Anaerolineae bacterium]